MHRLCLCFPVPVGELNGQRKIGTVSRGLSNDLITITDQAFDWVISPLCYLSIRLFIYSLTFSFLNNKKGRNERGQYPIRFLFPVTSRGEISLGKIILKKAASVIRWWYKFPQYSLILRGLPKNRIYTYHIWRSYRGRACQEMLDTQEKWRLWLMDYVFCLNNWNMKKLKGKIIEFVNSGVECLKSRTGANDQRVSRFCRHRSHSSLVTWNQEYEKL